MKNKTLAKKRRRSVIKTKTHKKGGGYFFKTKEEKEEKKYLAEIAKYNRDARKIVEEEREANRKIAEEQRIDLDYWNRKRLERLRESRLQESRLFQPYTQETIRREPRNPPINPPINQLPKTTFWWQYDEVWGNYGQGN